MQLELKAVIGGLFIVYGALLSLYGVFGAQAQYGRSLGLNMNVRWGLVLLVFGLCLVIFRKRHDHG